MHVPDSEAAPTTRFSRLLTTPYRHRPATRVFFVRQRPGPAWYACRCCVRDIAPTNAKRDGGAVRLRRSLESIPAIGRACQPVTAEAAAPCEPARMRKRHLFRAHVLRA